MGLTHALGVKWKISRLIKIDQDKCNHCKTCSSICPAWAITRDKDKQAEINYHACNACMDCVHACPSKAIRYTVTD
jgi:pyruvate formate lyase activating enzyme